MGNTNKKIHKYKSNYTNKKAKKKIKNTQIQKCPEKNLPGPTRHTGHLSLRGKITKIKKYTNTKVSGEESAWSDSAHGPSFTERQNNKNKKIHKYKSVRRRICLVRLGTRAIFH